MSVEEDERAAGVSSGMLRRIIGFGGLPLLSLLTPLLVLPLFARIAGPSGWASATAGESIGALFGLAVSYGWHSLGPARISTTDSVEERAQLYRESLVVRVAIAVVAFVPMVVVCLVLANDGFEALTVLMAVSTALVPLSISWYAVGVGRASDILKFEAVPRVGAALVSSVIIATTGWLYVFPLLAIVVPLIGVAVYSVRLLRVEPGPWPSPRAVPRILRRDIGPAANEMAAGAYAAIPVPLVNGVADAQVAAGYASADKLYRYGLFVPGTLANVFQRWTVEAGPAQVARRLRVALGAHAALGVVGLVILAALGPWVSAVMFGDAVKAAGDVCLVLGSAFAVSSIRTGMTRLVLFPAARVTTILRSTIVGGVVGLPLVAVAAVTVGPVGAAGGILASELIMTGQLVAVVRDVIRGHERTSGPTSSS